MTERVIEHLRTAAQFHSDMQRKYIRRRTGNTEFNSKMQAFHAEKRDDALCLIADITTGFVVIKYGTGRVEGDSE